MDLTAPLPRFIELVLCPQSRSQADTLDNQRAALESLRQARPGMLIDHVEDHAASTYRGPARRHPVIMRLRSHAEARTFDELRVFEIGRLIRKQDPEWHEVLVQLVYDARAILVDTTGIVADPANEGGVRAPRARPNGPRGGARKTSPRMGRPSGSDTSRQASPPPTSPGSSPQWESTAGDSPSADQRTHPPRDGGRSPSQQQHVPVDRTPSTQRGHRSRSLAPARNTGRASARFFALCEGRVRCNICGQGLTVQSMGHERKQFYTCPAKHLHPHTECRPEVFFPVEPVDDAVWKAIVSQIGNPEHALDAIRQAAAKGAAAGEDRKADLRKRLARLERDELEVLGLRSEDRISEGAARKRLNELTQERRQVRGALRDSDDGDDHELGKLARAVEALFDFHQRSGRDAVKADYGLRRRLLDAAIPKDGPKGIHLSATGTIEVESLLDDVALGPTLGARARSLGRAVDSLRDRMAAGRAARTAAKPERKSRESRGSSLRGLLARFRPERPTRSAPRPSIDLGEALRATTHSTDREASAVAPRQTPWLLYGGLLAISIAAAILFQPTEEAAIERENIVEELGLVGQLTVLNKVPGGWIGQASPVWRGAKDQAAALITCKAIEAQVHPDPRETITILRPGGVPIAECGPPVQ